MNKIAVLVAMGSLMLFITSCAKMPEKIQSPFMKISIVYANNNEDYTVRFSGGLANENSSTVLQNIKGRVSILDNKGKEVFSLPFKLDIVFPFSMGIIDTEKKSSKDEIAQLIELFNINQNELQKNKETDTIYIDEDKIDFSIDSYEKEDIVNLLKGVIHEEKK